MTRDERFEHGKRLEAVDDVDALLLGAFSKTSAIGLALLDNRYRFRVVNNVVATMHRLPADALIGNTMHDILGDAAREPEARFKRLLREGDSSAVEVSAMLPTRTEPGYWIEKLLIIKAGSGRFTQFGSINVEVTGQRKLEERFRRLHADLLWTNVEYQSLASHLHESINEYHAALGESLDRLSRCTRDPERIPELFTESMEFLERPMQKLASVARRCFPDQQH